MGWMAGVRGKERQEHEQTTHTRIQIFYLKREITVKRREGRTAFNFGFGLVSGRVPFSLRSFQLLSHEPHASLLWQSVALLVSPSRVRPGLHFIPCETWKLNRNLLTVLMRKEATRFLCLLDSHVNSLLLPLTSSSFFLVNREVITWTSAQPFVTRTGREKRQWKRKSDFLGFEHDFDHQLFLLRSLYHPLHHPLLTFLLSSQHLSIPLRFIVNTRRE